MRSALRCASRNRRIFTNNGRRPATDSRFVGKVARAIAHSQRTNATFSFSDGAVVGGFLDRTSATSARRDPQEESEGSSIQTRREPSLNSVQRTHVTESTPSTLSLLDASSQDSDIEHWTHLIDSRLRIDGPEGAWSIWKALRERKIDIPTDGPYADRIWNPCISAAIRLDALTEVYDYALDLFRRTGSRYTQLYDICIGYYLSNKPRHAYAWHLKLLELNLPVAGSLARLANVATTSKSSLKRFQLMHKKSEHRSIYDAIIPTLCTLGHYQGSQGALKWHDYLVSERDLPSSAQVTDQLRKHLEDSGETGALERVNRDLVDADLDADTISNNLCEQSKISRHMMNKIIGETHGFEEKIISDDFCARAFATKAFSLDFVMRACASFGVEGIGPVSLRQILIRCSNIDEASTNLEQLKNLGISIKDCAYKKIIARAVTNKDWGLLKSIVTCDQHPDVFDDVEIQKKLLLSYLRAHDWIQARRTIAILTVHHKFVRNEAWNVVLQGYLESRDFAKVTTVLDEMCASGAKATLKTLRVSFFCLLRPRQAHRRPLTDYDGLPSKNFDELGFLAGLWLRILSSGGYIPPSYWNQVLNRFGMTGRLAELELLSMKLASIYSSKTTALQTSLHDSNYWPFSHNTTNQHMLRSRRDRLLHHQLFPRQRQASIIEWGFITLGRPVRDLKHARSLKLAILQGGLDGASAAALHPVEASASSQEHSWMRGIVLLKFLHEQYGLGVERNLVRKICRQRLRQLFGYGRSTETHNRRAKRDNPYSLASMVQSINACWDEGCPLFRVDPSLLDDTVEARTKLKLTVLGTNSLSAWERKLLNLPQPADAPTTDSKPPGGLSGSRMKAPSKADLANE